MRAALFLLVPLLTSGCAELMHAATGLDQALNETIPAHPVTGKPMANIVAEEQEIAQAQQAWEQIESQATQQGIAIDPPGPRLDRVRSVFERLHAVAHRHQLPGMSTCWTRRW